MHIKIYADAKEFYESRFKRAFIPDRDEYASEWLERFMTGKPTKYMDKLSKQVYIEQQKRKIQLLKEANRQ